MPKRLTLENFIKRAQKIHDNKYNYSKVNYINAKTKVIIICPQHNKFEQIPDHHLRGMGCKKCAEIFTTNSNTHSVDHFIDRAKQIHSDKYNYSKTKYINSHKKVIIICPKHGEFLKTPNKHIIQKQGCYKCKKIEIGKTLAKTNKEFLKEIIQKRGNKYNYSKVNYINTHSKIIIICSKHGKFLQTPANHLNGQECPKCSHNISKGEAKWLDRIEQKENIKIERSLTIYINNQQLKPDGFHKPTNTIYEYYGSFYHGNPKIYNPNDINPISKKTFGELYQKTIEREKLLKSAGYNLITKWGN